MSDVLFIHSLNMHESHRMFAEALGERCFAEAIETDFELAYTKEKLYIITR